MMGYWGYYDRYEKKSPKTVKNGLKTKKKAGKIGNTWWSGRWIDVLESFHMGNRLTRGRSYARAGQVLSINVERCKVIAEVQGSRSRPYKIKMNIRILSDKDWQAVFDIMSKQALFAAKLLSGEMPQNIEEAFSTAKISLFPSSLKEIDTDCSCPDWANPCKHVAAVYYLLAERFDDDPFLIFKMRGRDKEDIINELRKRRAQAAAPRMKGEKVRHDKEAAARKTEPPEACLDEFWTPSETPDNFPIYIDREEDYPVKEVSSNGKEQYILKRLNDFPVEETEFKKITFNEIFHKIYNTAAIKAFEIISEV